VVVEPHGAHGQNAPQYTQCAGTTSRTAGSVHDRLQLTYL